MKQREIEPKKNNITRIWTSARFRDNLRQSARNQFELLVYNFCFQ